ncbi:toxin-activating lysine-acyltransferase [Propionivibrio dicarboxylicus]|nr:toxin-activating lysine-acyltransferase [Propionivibrio dicarboxylicus]
MARFTTTGRAGRPTPAPECRSASVGRNFRQEKASIDVDWTINITLPGNDNGDYLKATAWAGADDAYLMLDRNTNGLLDDGGELFSNGKVVDGARGLASLSWIDANGDGDITASDPVFDKLQVWQDRNGNGAVDDGEAKRLDDMEITALHYRRGSYDVGGRTLQMASPALESDAVGTRVQAVILGPALWLYARDPFKRFLFIGDLDWAVLPPVVLDQCRLYTRGALPYAFFTWALANEHVAARLRSAQPKIAPHEWKCGDEVWIIDAVAPFGQLEETLKGLRETIFAGRKVCALIPDPAKPGATTVREYPPADLPTKH